MPPHGHEEDPYELSFFQIDGELEITLEDDTFTARPGTALHIEPGVSLGVRNKGHRAARFVLTFNPPPKSASIERLKQMFVERGHRMKSPMEMQKMLSESK
jgi:quercetin dioxygenase-like cupin family protein